MAINFFSYAEAVPTQREFAICDDQNQQPVKMEHIGDSDHQVMVISNNRSDYSFIPVDKYRDAYICNWKKRNTLLNESRMELKNRFFKDCRAHLYIANTIKELV